jgi:hypothetical protein
VRRAHGRGGRRRRGGRARLREDLEGADAAAAAAGQEALRGDGAKDGGQLGADGGGSRGGEAVDDAIDGGGGGGGVDGGQDSAARNQDHPIVTRVARERTVEAEGLQAPAVDSVSARERDDSFARLPERDHEPYFSTGREVANKVSG